MSYNYRKKLRYNRGRRWSLSDLKDVPPVSRFYVFEYGNQTEPDTGKPEEVGALRVQDVDYRIPENAKQHYTDMYELTNRDVGPRQLVLRRGYPFDIDIQFDREFDKKKDDIRIVLETSDNPMDTKGTRVEMMLSDEDKPKKWGAKIMQPLADNKMRIRLFVPPTCIVSTWRLNMDTVVKSDGGQKTFRYKAKFPIYILFNPWCNDDTVYMPNANERDEYVLNSTGRIYKGNKNQITYSSWNFGQFEDFVLELVMWLLDNSGLGYQSRGNPVLISRKITALVNSSDDDGILVGNWSGDYNDGTSPMAWQGSVRILEEYWQTKQPVKFGQCWVFSGVTTSVCRALGLPARSVTNFSSAHDCDGSVTIDCHWNCFGEPLDQYNRDSVWNFHVWNEAWMARPDLVHKFGGWQAIDATPQEASDGVYCAGPASIEAMKQGLVHLPYDAPFIFAEVNADRVHWIQQSDGGWHNSSTQKDRIGKNISTKKANCDEREDVTWMYKYPEGSQEERAAVYRANIDKDHRGDIYNVERNDVTIDLVNKENALMGKPLKIDVTATNKASLPRTVSVTLNASIAYYTGVPVGSIKKASFKIELPPTSGTKETRTMVVEPQDYLGKLVDMCHIKVRCMAQVAETKQFHCEEDDFRLIKPDLIMKVPERVTEGQEFVVEASFTNPIPSALTKCYYTLESPGLKRPIKVDYKPVGPNAKVTFSEKIKALKTGKFDILMSFESKELSDTKGMEKIVVTPKW